MFFKALGFCFRVTANTGGETDRQLHAKARHIKFLFWICSVLKTILVKLCYYTYHFLCTSDILPRDF